MKEVARCTVWLGFYICLFIAFLLITLLMSLQVLVWTVDHEHRNQQNEVGTAEEFFNR